MEPALLCECSFNFSDPKSQKHKISGNRPIPTMTMPIVLDYFDVLQLDSDRFAFCGGYDAARINNFDLYVYSRSQPGI